MRRTPTSSYISTPRDVELRLHPGLIRDLSVFAANNRSVIANTLLTFMCLEDGLEVFYGLDFDVIEGYAAPWSRDIQNAAMIRYIIEEGPIKFTLLPGTVEELFFFVRYAKNQKLEAKQLITGLLQFRVRSIEL